MKIKHLILIHLILIFIIISSLLDNGVLGCPNNLGEGVLWREYVNFSQTLRVHRSDEEECSGCDGDGNNNGVRDKSNKKDSSNDGDGGDRYEGDDSGGKIKGSKMDFLGQPGFDYKYSYHSGFEFEYLVGELQAPWIFHHEDLIQNIQLKGVMDMSAKNCQDGKVFANTTVHLNGRLNRTRKDKSVYNEENNESNGSDVDGEGDHRCKNSAGRAKLKHYKTDTIGRQIGFNCKYGYQGGYYNMHPFVGLQCVPEVQC